MGLVGKRHVEKYSRNCVFHTQDHSGKSVKHDQVENKLISNKFQNSMNWMKWTLREESHIVAEGYKTLVRAPKKVMLETIKSSF